MTYGINKTVAIVALYSKNKFQIGLLKYLEIRLSPSGSFFFFISKHHSVHTVIFIRILRTLGFYMH